MCMWYVWCVMYSVSICALCMWYACTVCVHVCRVCVMCVMCAPVCACDPPAHLGPLGPRLHVASLSHEQETRGCRDTPMIGVSSHHSRTSGLCSHKSCGFQTAFKVSCGRPMCNMMEAEGLFLKQSRESPKGFLITLDTSGGPRSLCEDPHGAGSFDAHRVEGFLGCPGLLCGCVCDYGTEQIPTLPAAAGLWSRANTKPSVFPEGWHCWWLDKYTHTHTHTHTHAHTQSLSLLR